MDNKTWLENQKRWIAYRNYLRAIACTMDVNTIEYKNICARIKYAHNRAWAR